MTANLIDEIKAVEEEAAKNVQKAQAAAVKKLNQAAADAENAVKTAKRSAVRQFREKIQAAERAAEEKAKKTVTEREAGAEAFYSQNKGKLAKVSAWITEEVMSQYGRS